MFPLHLQASQVGATSAIHYMVRLVLLTLCGWVLCWTLVNLFRSHSVLNLLFLGYPFGVYVPLCCFHQDSRAQPLPADCGYLVQDQVADDGASAVSSLVKDFFSLLWESLREQFNNPTSIPTHSCPLSPDLIRNEVECLKADFNRRIKEVLFNSLFSAYYVAFLPLCFVKVAVVWLSLCPCPPSPSDCCVNCCQARFLVNYPFLCLPFGSPDSGAWLHPECTSTAPGWQIGISINVMHL